MPSYEVCPLAGSCSKRAGHRPSACSTIYLSKGKPYCCLHQASQNSWKIGVKPAFSSAQLLKWQKAGARCLGQTDLRVDKVVVADLLA